MIRIRWAVFAFALGCLLTMGRPVAATASASAGAISSSAQGLRAASARVAHAGRTAPLPSQNRPARRNPATPTHRLPTHHRIARHRGRTHQSNAFDWNDRNFAEISDVQSMMPDRFRAQMGETERALGSRGPPRASPPVTARVEPPPSSTAPSVHSVSPAHSIRAPPPTPPTPSHLDPRFRFTHAARHEGRTAPATPLPSGDI